MPSFDLAAFRSRREHALCDLPPDVREPLDLLFAEVERAYLDARKEARAFRVLYEMWRQVGRLCQHELLVLRTAATAFRGVMIGREVGRN